MPSRHRLVNVETQAATYPATFHIGPRDLRESLFVGCFAKVIFATDGPTERMWCEIIARRGGRYVGRLDNHPVLDHGGLACGDSVEFGPEHIADMQPPADLHARLGASGRRSGAA